ncbi:hypothetical protein NDA11_005869 [Ustilago hordei]|uniref:Uncharacterized protein n=1 Tax=Ustilago hordei TaxID=120017 RepID=I2FRG7_USTHO|nr:hypothetical protein NDA10_006858 [Ustilago hordei]KAJ1572757.1 hypothetical protein NDA15_003043 [Ustilago hordei]KAJ1575285.1 hypothetical protein NDA11_005869 [Ustilago hordei]KAJ1575834.1 hypothetical protein NDA12_007164 [Ustilago hordei]KAJ1598101.1 hypothetical protein NDA14_004652 [Ustilago hordei]
MEQSKDVTCDTAPAPPEECIDLLDTAPLLLEWCADSFGTAPPPLEQHVSILDTVPLRHSQCGHLPTPTPIL